MTALTTRAVIAHGPKQLAVEAFPVSETGAGEVKIRVGVGGICGSDLHYYHNGGFGAVRLKAPMVLGHELAGTIIEIGDGVTAVRPGQRVAINPSLPCGECENCRAGIRNHCTNMRFFGSAMRTPHIDGGFRDILVCKASQAVPIPDTLSMGEAAMGEPLAVCLHAVAQAGPVAGKRILITGAGPIGVLVAAAARLAGATDITITDVMDEPLAIAAQMGASSTINVMKQTDGLEQARAQNGGFDVHFEAAGNASATLSGLAALRAKGICVLIGQGAEIPLQASALIGREIEMRGSFRFDPEFRQAIEHLSAGRINVKPMITATLSADRAVQAFDLASDKRQSMKVQLAFAD